MTNDNIEEINNYERHQMHEEKVYVMDIVKFQVLNLLLDTSITI